MRVLGHRGAMLRGVGVSGERRGKGSWSRNYRPARPTQQELLQRPLDFTIFHPLCARSLGAI